MSSDALVVIAGAALVIGLSVFGVSRGTSHAGAHLVAPLPKPNLELNTSAKPGDERSVVLAGGCFWCTEGAFAKFNGVKDVVSGYAGDTKETANYKAVCTGNTKHAEAIKITYDPNVITYSQLLQIFFLAHDPTTKNRQGNDVGPQYRSAIFYANDDEKTVAEAYIKQLNDAKVLPAPIVTTIEPLTEFFVAEGYHQDYVANNPDQGYVRACAIPKMDKVSEAYADWLKKE